MVYYRKYRPQTISELDLPDVREKLLAILSSQSLPHAFLFTGSKGLGKTSSARILAKAINCENRRQRSENSGQEIKKNKKTENLNAERLTLNGSIEPCNKCDNCVSITNGSNIDVLEIDAASNGGVEEIRTLRERVKFSPSSLQKKVYIIDEVHMLSPGAFNALLKTLEEPPSHVVFILATTELQKLPPTVVSRTFKIQFEKPTIEQMVESLKRIVVGEKLKVEDGVLARVANISDRAFRDSAKNLEELVLNSNGKKISNELFDLVFKTGGLSSEVLILLQAYASRDAKLGLETIGKLSLSGVDFKNVFERLVDHLRGLLMLRNGIESGETDVPGLSLPNIHQLLELANEAYSELKVSVIPQLPLELMTVKYCILDSVQEPAHSRQMTEDRGQKTQASSYEPGARIQNQELSIKRTEKGIQELDTVIASETKQSQVLNSILQPKNLLSQLITELNKVNKPGAALLRSAKSAGVIGSEIVIVTPFPIHADRLKSDKVLPDLHKAGEIVVGKKVEVIVRIR